MRLASGHRLQLLSFQKLLKVVLGLFTFLRVDTKDNTFSAVFFLLTNEITQSPGAAFDFIDIIQMNTVITKVDNERIRSGIHIRDGIQITLLPGHDGQVLSGTDPALLFTKDVGVPSNVLNDTTRSVFQLLLCAAASAKGI